MALFVTDKDKLNSAMEATADAIRAKTGGDALIPWDYANNKGFADAIAAIPGGGSEPVLENLTVTENGIYTPPTGVDGFSQVIVGVTVRSPRCDQVTTFDWAAVYDPDYNPSPPTPPTPPTPTDSSWTTGTDENVAAILDAAAAGTIDLQEDAGWRVGDVRTIHVDAWRSADGVLSNAIDARIVITSFAEYMSCGNLLQFDFVDVMQHWPTMDNAGNSFTGGYGDTDMYALTLPALVEALPSWLKTRLKTFSVLAAQSESSATVIQVPRNKLALRSEVEVFGTHQYSVEGEGTQLPYYQTNAARTKYVSNLPGTTVQWSLRSRVPTSAQVPSGYSYFGAAKKNAETQIYYSSFGTAGTTTPIAPFGCLGGAPAPLPGPSVSFSSGSDADVAAAIDAANAGTINLQNGANAWHVGDTRTIHLSAFTAGNNVTNAAEDIEIVITSFDEYANCGNVLQFDFKDCLTTDLRLSDTSTTVGGYGATEMYSTTLPALVEALPSWIKSRLKTFSVLASAGGSDLSTIETVTGNKLALRSEIEIFGTITYSQPGEGSHIQYYSDTASRIKGNGNGGPDSHWWERSPYNSTRFCCVVSVGSASNASASLEIGVAPFGCL